MHFDIPPIEVFAVNSNFTFPPLHRSTAYHCHALNFAFFPNGEHRGHCNTPCDHTEQAQRAGADRQMSFFALNV